MKPYHSFKGQMYHLHKHLLQVAVIWQHTPCMGIPLLEWALVVSSVSSTQHLQIIPFKSTKVTKAKFQKKHNARIMTGHSKPVVFSYIGDYIPARTCPHLHLLPQFFPTGAAGSGNTIQLLLLPMSIPLRQPMFLSSTLTLSLVPPPHPGKGKINTSYYQLTTQTSYALLPLSCSLRQRGHLHRVQPEADYGHGKCQVRHGARTSSEVQSRGR